MKNENIDNGNQEDLDPKSSDVQSSEVKSSTFRDVENLAIEMFGLFPRSALRKPEDAIGKEFKFWNTQPVPKLDEVITTSEPIENKDISDIQKEEFKLPEGFTWDTLNIDDPAILKELYTLLNENYVEDDDKMFRFDYSPQFLKWALKPPFWVQDWHCGVRATKSNKLVGFISAIPAFLRVHNKEIKMVEINFLCVHKKIRSKRLAPMLIREITRRVQLTGIFQAMYTAGVVLPKPIGTCRYWHRPLNPKKLLETRFSHLTRNMTLKRWTRLLKLPMTPKLSGFRKLEKGDIDKVHESLNKYLKQFDLAPIFSVDEVAHWFLPRPDVVDSFVVERNNNIVGFTSFYTLPSTVVNHAKYRSIKAAYSFYIFPSSDIDLQDLINDALIVANNTGHDVFNALDLMENKKFLENLKFGMGDGSLQYYFYNWKCPNIPPEKIGLVLQ